MKKISLFAIVLSGLVTSTSALADAGSVSVEENAPSSSIDVLRPPIKPRNAMFSPEDKFVASDVIAEMDDVHFNSEVIVIRPPIKPKFKNSI
jgi:hypothetical protein